MRFSSLAALALLFAGCSSNLGSDGGPGTIGGDLLAQVSLSSNNQGGAAPLATTLICSAGGVKGSGLSYAWNFGDKTPVKLSGSSQESHTFAAAGIYTVTCKVSDGSGGFAFGSFAVDARTAPSANKHHVDAASGNDSNDGSESKPWRTIQHAADSLQPGDTVLVHAGTYNERVQINHSGSADANRITYRAAGAIAGFQGFSVHADYITIDGFQIDSNTSSDGDYEGIGIYVDGSYVSVLNNTIRDAPWGGVFLGTNSTYGITSANHMSYNGQNGVAVHGSYNLVEGNTITKSVQWHRNGGSAYQPDADGMRFHGDHHRILRNFIPDPALLGDVTDESGTYIGHNDDPHIDCFQTYGKFDATAYDTAATNTLFDGNYCRNYVPSMAVFMITGWTDDPAHDITIQNNVFEATNGINAHGLENGTSGITYNLYVYNNTWIGNATNRGESDPIALFDFGSAYEIKNNITIDFGSHRSLWGDCTGGVIANNLAWNSDGTTPKNYNAPPGATELWGVDPKFVRYGNTPDLTGQPGWDYHLQAGSPAIDVGDSPADVTTDYDGRARPQGARLDIGAYEY